MLIKSIKNIFITIKKHIFFWKKEEVLFINSNNDKKESFLKTIQVDEAKILDIKNKVENNEIKLEELSDEQQIMLLKAYQIQKRNLEDSIAKLQYQLNKT